MKQKLLSLVLCLLFLCAIPCTALAEEGMGGMCGESAYWYLDLETYVLEISGYGSIDDYIYQNPPWEPFNWAITTIIIYDGIDRIGEKAFAGCTALTEISFPETLTKISPYAFLGCTALEEILLPISISIIGNYAFSDCDNLKHVYYPGSLTQWNKVAIDKRYNPELSKETITFNYGLSPDTVLDSGSCGENLIWEFRADNTMTVSGTGKMYDYTSSANTPWKNHLEAITRLVIEPGVTSIGKYAFRDAVNLADISFSEGLLELGYQAFQGCDALETIQCPESLKKIDGYTFGFCDGLKSIILPKQMETIGAWTFSWCHALETVVMPEKLDTLGIGVFDDCESLRRIGLPEGLTSIPSDTFYDCSLLTVVNIPKSVTTIGESAFRNCIALEQIEIPEGVTAIGELAFSGCSALQTMTIPASVSEIGEGAFGSCTALQKISVADGNPNYTVDEAGVLYNQEKTLLLQYPAGKTETSFTVPATVTAIGNSAFSSALPAEIILPNGLQTIGTSAFEKSKLESIRIPDSVSVLSSDLFSECASLKEIILPKNITKIPYRFCYYASALQSIVIPDKVTEIEYDAFNRCERLSNITLPAGITKIGDKAFYCQSTGSLLSVRYKGTQAQWNLISIESNNTMLNNVKKIYQYTEDSNTVINSGTCGNNLRWTLNDSGLLQITGSGAMRDFATTTEVPWNTYRYQITSVRIADTVTSIGSYAFHSCRLLTEINIPDSVTVIGAFSFQLCSGLKQISFSKNLKTIGKCAFSSCASLKEITIPKSITALEDSVFHACSNLTKALLPDTITSIHTKAFQYCKNMTIIGQPGSVAESFAKSNNFLFLPAYTVTFDANGGTNAPEAFSATEEAPEIKLPEQIPNRLGYRFIGWSANPYASSAEYQPNTDISVTFSGVTLYAVWEKACYTATKPTMTVNQTIYTVSPETLPETREIILVCYQNGKMVFLEVLSASETNYSCAVPTHISYDTIKILTLGSLNSLTPLTEAEILH